MTDPFSIIVGTVGIIGVGGQVVQSARDFNDNYRHADKQMQHALSQLEILQSTLESTPLQLHPRLAAAQSSFEAISGNFPDDLRSDSRRARLRWAAKNKGKATEILSQLKEMEISTIFALQLEHL
jgi:hypothetical protein